MQAAYTAPAPSVKVTEFHVKDFWSSMTHFIGFIMSFCGTLFLLPRAARTGSLKHLIAMSVFSFSLLLLYAASTCYHALDLSPKGNRILKKIDHMMISVLIAGSYTPVCLLVLPGSVGLPLLAVIWGLAAAGILIKAFWVFCPKWVSSVLYIGMGWACIFVVPMLFKLLPLSGFMWLLAGGLFYTVGGVIYALKLPAFNSRHANFGSHEIFHLFVMAGSICHFIVMYETVLAM
jgi:hemolysin III